MYLFASSRGTSDKKARELENVFIGQEKLGKRLTFAQGEREKTYKL